MHSAASATVVIGGALASAIVTSLSATAAFLSTSTGLTVFTAGMAAGGATYGGWCLDTMIMNRRKMYNRLNETVEYSLVNVSERFNSWLMNGFSI